MELREEIARALDAEMWSSGLDKTRAQCHAPIVSSPDLETWDMWLREADCVLKVIRPIIEERDALRAEIENVKEVEFPRKVAAVAEGWRKKVERLEAEINATKKQEPVAAVRINAINGNPSVVFTPGHHYLHHSDHLYLAPGAQPAAIPEGWQLVPKEPSTSMKTAGICVEIYADSPPEMSCLTWEEVSAIYKAMLAAAPNPGDKP